MADEPELEERDWRDRFRAVAQAQGRYLYSRGPLHWRGSVVSEEETAAPGRLRYRDRFWVLSRAPFTVPSPAASWWRSLLHPAHMDLG
jgi:hypothetical protein